MAVSSNNTLQFANIEDEPQIRKFINDEWKENHILSRDRAFFDYQHRDKEKINFVISKDVHHNINAVLGFIPCSTGPGSDIFTVIWKVAKNNGTPVLGMELLQFLKSSGRFRTIMSLGINEKTVGLYRYLGMHIGQADHYVLLNHDINEYQIAIVDKSIIIPQTFVGQISKIKSMQSGVSFKFEEYKNRIPYKDSDYFNKRYFGHPIYHYDVYGVFYNDVITSMFVTRLQCVENRCVLRMVDFLGEEKDMPLIAGFLSEFITINHYEYADFLCAGFNEALMLKSGFLRVDHENQDLVIPNYFSPFERKNVGINYFADTDQIHKLRICKADGDQDRPN